jgi:hypothetical protein
MLLALVNRNERETYAKSPPILNEKMQELAR